MLVIKNLSKSYGKKQALDNFNMKFEPGVYAILGANGSGKTTLLNLLTDNIKRDSGEILFEGEEILSLKSKYRELIGYMPQQNGFYEDFSVLGFLNYLASIKGLTAKQRKTQIESLLQKMNLSEVSGEKMKTLSGGMKQRVLLIQALLGTPRILILDEPTAGLDPKERVNLKNYIKGISQDKIVLITTHVVTDVESIADCILIMKKGKLLAKGTLKDLLKKTNTENLEKLYLNYFRDVVYQ